MSDKILNEAFNRLSQLEEEGNADKMVFRALAKLFDNTEAMYERLELGQLGRQMDALGYDGDRKAIQARLSALMDDLGDTLPGLEMQVRGED